MKGETMRKLFLTFLLAAVVFSFLGAENCYAQDGELPVIQVNTTSANYEKKSENNFELTFRWEPAVGAQRYVVMYGYQVGDSEEGLPESFQVPNDSTIATIPVTSKNCFVQVIGFDDANQPVARSGIYNATFTIGEETITGPGFDFIFLEAFGKSFVDMDPIAGWAIVAGIFFLLLYGIYMVIFMNKEVGYQDHMQNKELNQKVKSVYDKWSTFDVDKVIAKKIDSLVDERWAKLTGDENDKLRIEAVKELSQREIDNLVRDELDALKKETLRKRIIQESKFDDEKVRTRLAKEELGYIEAECRALKEKRYSIMRIFEAGLENHIANFGRENASQEVDRDMEKAIFCEIDNLKIGNHGKKDKHVSLNRIKMFAEISPMLGLLGTVSGLIVAFFNILQESSAENGGYQNLLSELSGGIYSAIVTTIIGLIIGIALLFLHHTVEGKIRRLQNTWQNLYREISRHIA
jgi:biopolymer transport protein ExbB/TolQ